MKKLLTLTAALSLAASAGFALAQDAGGAGSPSTGAASEGAEPGGAVGADVGSGAGSSDTAPGGKMAPAEKMGPSGAAAERATGDQARPDRAESGPDKQNRNAGKTGKSNADRAATKDDAGQGGTEKQRAQDATTGKSSAEGRSTGEEGAAGSSASLTGEKRTQVQKAFSSHRSDAKADIDIDVSIGVAIPRHVHLVAIPDDIVVIAPHWRRYKYIVVKDVICIVDPDTYEIVDVLVLA